MFMIVFTAFVGAGVAHIGAQHHKLPHKFGIPGGEAAAHPAKIGTIPTKPDAIPHHHNVLFPQTGGCAVFAGSSAIKTNLNMLLVVVLHCFHNLKIKTGEK
jgi:hypothetical protein